MLDVPAYMLQAGCSPTAAAMLLGYWDANGFPDLMADASTTESVTPDIWHLAVLMQTDESLGGMTIMGWQAFGIEAFAAEKGYEFSTTITMPDFEVLKSEIDAGRPFVATVTPMGDLPADMLHDVTVIGYQGNDYCFHDGWTLTTHCEPYSRFNYGLPWGIAFATYVQPHQQQNVPEPSSMAMLAVGTGFAFWRKLRNPNTAR